MYMCNRYNSVLRVYIEISKKTFDHHFGRQLAPRPSPEDNGCNIRLYCPERKCGLSLAHPIWQLSRQRVILSDAADC